MGWLFVDSKLGVPLESLVNRNEKGLMTYYLVRVRLLIIKDNLIFVDPATPKVVDELVVNLKSLGLVKIRIREPISYSVLEGIDQESVSLDGKITTKPD